MPRFTVPPADTRIIKPTFKRRVAFACLGIATVFIRVITSPYRFFLAPCEKERPIFIYEPYGMGDILASQPLVASFLQSGRKVIFAGKSIWKEIFPENKNFTFVSVSPPYVSYDEKQKYRKLFSEVRNLVKILKPYTAGANGIDIRGDTRSIAIMYLAGCRKVSTFDKYYTATDSKVMPFAAKRFRVPHGTSRRMINGVFLPPGIELGKVNIKHLIPPNVIIPVTKRIGIIPLTPWVGKQWIPERWRELIWKIQAEGLEPVILCGPGEAYKAMTSTYTYGMRVECREADTIKKWVALIAKCGYIISVNTGPMHIAAALNKPMVVLDGSSRLPLWAPESDRAIVVHHQDTVECAPCHQVGEVLCNKRCMIRISADEVLSALRDCMKL